MSMEKGHQIILSKMLGLGDFEFEREKPATWAEIYEAIGKLKERVSQPPAKEYIPWIQPMPLQVNQPANPNLHYHGAMPCYQNPCIWC